VHSRSSSSSSSDESFGFSQVTPKPNAEENDPCVRQQTISSSSSSSLTSFDVHTVDQSNLVTVNSSTLDTLTSLDEETHDVNKPSVRRSSRRSKPNSKYTTDFVSPIGSASESETFSPKRSRSASNATYRDSGRQVQQQHRRKRMKSSPPNSPDMKLFAHRTRQITTTIGSLKLIWPRYGINDAIYMGQTFSVTNTCPLDTGLFALYHAYKAGTNNFRKLFENDTLNALTTLRQTFQCVESDGWTIARLDWLVRHDLLTNHLLTKTAKDGQYDIKDTLNAIVFRFVQPMQEYTITSKCSTNACPKQIRKNTSVDIALS
jgi:hypothetical protein